MASYQFFIAALVLVLVQQCCCQDIAGPTQITITPTTLSLAPNEADSTGGQVTVQCRASSLKPGQTLFAMNIQRVLHTSPNADPIVAVGASTLEDQGNAVLKLQSLQGATVTGGTGDASITLTMSMAQCADAGIYYCTASALDSDTKIKYYEAFTNMTIGVSPGTITLTPTPSGINSWKVNQTLVILCNGVVGTVVNENNIEWVWQYQKIDPNFPGGFENWQDYSIIGDPTTDIVTGSLGASTSDCYKRQTSTLTRYLTLDDTNRQYRCYVNNRDVTSQGVDHAQMVEVGTVTESGVAPIIPGPSSGGCCQKIEGPTDITITPARLSLAPNASDSTGGQVTVQCRASSLKPGHTLYAMNIQRVLHTSPNADPTVVVGASTLEDQGNAVLKLQSLQGATVTGGTGDASITLTMSMAQCADAGIYYCTASALDSETKIKYYETIKNVTIEVSPGTITLTANPSGISSWKVNETLAILCNGVVGTVVNENNIEWVWQYQKIDPNFPGIENWQAYSIIGDPTTDIVTGSLGASTSDCYKRQTSTLTRYLTLDDTNRQYRCYVNNRDVTSQGVDHAQMVEVGTVTESDVAPITPGPSTGVTTTTVSTQTDKSADDRLKTCDCPDVGVIIGAVVAVLIVIDVVILAVVIIVLKRRMVGSATQTMSEETRGKDNQMSSLDNVNRPVEQRPVEQHPTAAAENPNTYDGLIMRDVGVASLYQDLGSPYELLR